MSGGARIGLVVATVAAIALAFVLLSPGGGGSDSASTTSTPTTPAAQTQTETTADLGTAAPETTTTPTTPFEKIRVQGGKPVGGVKTLTVKKGDRVRIEISSTDATDEVHLHGYDLKRDLEANASVRFSFDADAEGIFEIELEDAGVQIGKLVVEP